MEVFIPVFELQHALKLLSAVVKPNAKDSTAHVLIDVSNEGRVVLAAYNGKLALTHFIDDCKAESEGKICVSYTKLSSFVGSFPPWADGVGVKDVHIKQLKNNISVRLENTFDNGKVSKNKILLAKQPTHQVYIPPPFQAPTFTINASVLRAALTKVSYAVDQASTRPFIQGMNLKFAEEFIYFTGTDGLKLSEYRVNNTGNLKEGSFIVPHAFSMALRKIADAESQMFFEIVDGSIKAVVGNTTLHGNLIIGEQYPEYTQLFEKFTHTLTIDKFIFMSTFVPYLNILNAEDNKRLTIELKDGKLMLTSDYSEAEYEGGIDFKGDFVIDVNGQFLSQTLDAIMDDTVELKFSDAKGVLLFDSANFHDQRALITPVKRRV
jgi:DNA polymerase III sliding clamp (beta) subunit (PCNA family)